MAEIRVTSAVLRNKAANFQNYISKFESERQNLVSAEQTLMSKFEGDAATTFDANFKAFNLQMENFKKVVDEYVIKLNTIAEAYERSEAQAAQAAGQK